jgi:hypothetical protein
VVTLALTVSGRRIVRAAAAARQDELAAIIGRLPPADRAGLTTTLRQLVAAAGEGNGTVPAAGPAVERDRPGQAPFQLAGTLMVTGPSRLRTAARGRPRVGGRPSRQG